MAVRAPAALVHVTVRPTRGSLFPRWGLLGLLGSAGLVLSTGCKDDPVPLGKGDDTGAISYPDEDGDGYGTDTDCDDTDPAIHPDALELCDGINNDCDAVIDEPGDGGDTYYRDADGDGYGDQSSTITACDRPPGYITVADDCDDTTALSNPGNAEICNDGIDNNCNGDDTECQLSGDQPLAAAPAVLTGATNGDKAGTVFDAGDFDGNGYNDVVVGASYNDGAGADSGRVYVMSGPIDASASLTVAAATLTGPTAGYGAGNALGVGDLNEDGYDDLVIGASKAKNGGTDSGAVYLVHGPLAGAYDLSLADLILVGDIANDVAGSAVTALGDVTGDGAPDLALGATGQGESSYQNQGAVYIISGALTGTVDLSTPTAKITGEDRYDRLGSAVVNAGDTDGDGVDEVALSAYTWPNNHSQGAVYLFEGPLAGVVDVLTYTARLEGEEDNDQAGYGLAAGDLDGDGYGDLVLGAPLATEDEDEQGVVYIVNGPMSGSVGLASATSRIVGAELRGNAGTSVDADGDVDGDGRDDLLIGVPASDLTAVDAGAAYLVFGPAPAGTSTLGASGLGMAGVVTRDNAGTSVGFLGRLNSDLIEDLGVGAPAEDSAGTDAGAIYLLFGQGI